MLTYSIKADQTKFISNNLKIFKTMLLLIIFNLLFFINGIFQLRIFSIWWIEKNLRYDDIWKNDKLKNYSIIIRNEK